MKQITLIFLLTMIFSPAICSQSNKIESVYTNLTQADCRTIKSEPWYERECPGLVGYKLEVIDGGDRQDLSIISPLGQKIELDFLKNVSPAFSSFGKKAEWRIKREGKKVKPVALIVRFEISEPDHPTNPGRKSFLVVVKIKPETVCITDVVNPSKNQNRMARKLADAAVNKQCLKAEGTD